MSKIAFSFEVFPPRTPDTEARMWSAIAQVAPLEPSFVSVTYGAGGTTRDYTHRIAKTIAGEKKLKAAAHLTCVGAERGEIDAVARAHWEAGVRHIVALRGDPPKGTPKYIPHAKGYAYTTDLIGGLKAIADFEISVSAYPEKHPESESFDEDIRVLKMKQESGADRAITQFFFEDDFFLRLRDRASKAGVTIPVIPGIIPINNFAGVSKFSRSCGTSMPAEIEACFEGLEPDSEAHNAAAIEVATRQCQHLINEGVDFFHFYSMNRGDLIEGVIRNL